MAAWWVLSLVRVLGVPFLERLLVFGFLTGGLRFRVENVCSGEG